MGGVETIDMPQTGVTCVSGGGAIYVNLLDFEKCKSFAFLKFFLKKFERLNIVLHNDVW